MSIRHCQLSSTELHFICQIQSYAPNIHKLFKYFMENSEDNSKLRDSSWMRSEFCCWTNRNSCKESTSFEI